MRLTIYEIRKTNSRHHALICFEQYVIIYNFILCIFFTADNMMVNKVYGSVYSGASNIRHVYTQYYRLLPVSESSFTSSRQLMVSCRIWLPFDILLQRDSFKFQNDLAPVISIHWILWPVLICRSKIKFLIQNISSPWRPNLLLCSIRDQEIGCIQFLLN
jgi:hypothetical protein